MISAILGFSILIFAFAAPGLIIFAAGKTLGYWANRAKVNFDAIPPASRREWFVRGLKA